MNKRQQGYIYEKMVEDYLKEESYEILDKNYTIRGGEIDIIVRKDNVVCFVEVKWTKYDMDFQDYITEKKKKALIKTAKDWKMKNEEDSIEEYRFDLALVVNEDIDYIENFLF